MNKKPLRTYGKHDSQSNKDGIKYIPSTLKLLRFEDTLPSFYFGTDDEKSNRSNPLESTFDRIKKTAKLPPLPVHTLDNTEYTTSDSSDEEPLELIPIENPKLRRETTSKSRRKKQSATKSKQPKPISKATVGDKAALPVAKELPNKMKKPRKRQPIRREHSNDENNEGIEFPPLRKTRKAQKQNTTDNPINKSPDKLAKVDKDNKPVNKELKECCVILTRMNLNDKNLNQVSPSPILSCSMPSTSITAIYSDNYDTKKVENDVGAEELSNIKECRVILSRLEFDSENCQEESQFKQVDAKNFRRSKMKPKSLLNTNMSVISSTPFERRIGSIRSRPMLSPIKYNNANTSIVNGSKTILLDQTSKIFSDENSSLSNKRGVKLSKIKGKNLSESEGSLNEKEKFESFKPDASSISESLGDKTTKLISDDSDEVIQDTYAHIDNNNILETEQELKSKDKNPLKGLIELQMSIAEEEKENSYYDSLSLYNDTKDVEMTENKFKINDWSKSFIYSQDESTTSQSNSNINKIYSKNDTLQSSFDELYAGAKIGNTKHVQISYGATIRVDQSKEDRFEVHSQMSAELSEFDEESIHLVLSNTSSDKDSNENIEIPLIQVANNKNLPTDPQNSMHQQENDDNSASMSINDNNNSSIDREHKNANPIVLSNQLSNPTRITERRETYKNWGYPLDAILESSKGSNSSKRLSVSDPIPEKNNDKSDDLQIASTSQEKINDSMINASLKHDDKILFLKPGKSWARSLSILNNIHNENDIECLSLGKGKKWRQSVRSVLSMQPQGSALSCIKGTNNDDKTLHGESELNDPRISLSTSHGAIEALSPGRFIRRMSVRVVPNNKSNKIIDKAIQDTSFLEVYGIATHPTDKLSSTRSSKSLTKASRETRGYNLRCSIVPEILEAITPEPVISARGVVLQRCEQTDSLLFEQCYPDSYLKHCRKIGEGVYGEVFLFDHPKEKSVIKIIPIEGTDLVNGEPQKKFNEILSEIIIAKELHNLRFHETYRTSGFVEVKNVKCIMGKYPEKLLDLWQVYDEEKNSENDCPTMFKEDQLYISLELGDGGQDMEAFLFHNATEAYNTFLQTALTLAVGEKSLEFEHRDMHWGNILISRTKEKQVSYKLGDEEITVACNGLKVAIIDFTLSRMSYEGCCIFNDLALDPALFNAAGEYQFEIYRLMRANIGNNWHLFKPYTNILWLHYTLDKMVKEVRYNKKTTKIHKTNIQKLQELKDIILDYDSAFDFITNCDKLTSLQRRCSGN